MKDGTHIIKIFVYLALAIHMDGQKKLLGLWIEQNKSVKF
jgi:transposase-like protein